MCKIIFFSSINSYSIKLMLCGDFLAKKWKSVEKISFFGYCEIVKKNKIIGESIHLLD